mgnify:CR=1 FL=1
MTQTLSELTNIAFIRALPGRSLDLGRELCALVAPTREEDGCLDYEVHQSGDDPDIWFLYENWRSAEDMEAHFDTPHFMAFSERAEALLEGDLTLHRFMRYSAMTTIEAQDCAA